ncbi:MULTISPECIES: FtsX-like permease family protein [unclassified Pseudoalteromonas]|uniref:ABC transporter permease n=1 Tax=unclassified Pseudoalteromonas TaxID=194690 RepID=UPI0025B48914|nr:MULTISPECIES: FtsX-like permease family protein [unclassified Pseudoalteromonas]MDN3379167.1 FtsX-like permease family protein [Pseudoalteromonas sp. APC 3893]MDN3387662.1 FtsX-like permease family protein [Pseudoalteromonas sp. APC 4017]
MTEVGLQASNLLRNKVRLILNLIAIFTAFFLFSMLSAFGGFFSSEVDLSLEDRLIVTNRINLTQPMPIAHVAAIRNMENVKNTTFLSWFPAYHKERKNQIGVAAVDAESYFSIYTELQLKDEQMQQWLRERGSAVVGARLANSNQWKVGDLVHIGSSVFHNADGSNVWPVRIVGIYDSEDPRADTNKLFIHHQYFSESRLTDKDTVSMIVLQGSDASKNEELAKRIDKKFANSANETKTSSEKEFTKTFIKQVADINAILAYTVSATFATIILIVANTMALAVNERTSEIAVLKTLGFKSSRIFRIVLTESLVIAIVGGLLGVLCAKLLLDTVNSSPDFSKVMPNLILTGEIALQAFFLMVLLGCVAGLLPAIRAMKLNISTAFSRS